MHDDDQPLPKTTPGGALHLLRQRERRFIEAANNPNYDEVREESARSLLHTAERTVWTVCARVLGWEWSPAYGGFVRADYHPNGPGYKFDSRPSELDAEEACFIDGIETLEQAVAKLEEADAAEADELLTAELARG